MIVNFAIQMPLPPSIIETTMTESHEHKIRLGSNFDIPTKMRFLVKKIRTVSTRLIDLSYATSHPISTWQIYLKSFKAICYNIENFYKFIYRYNFFY